MQEEYYENQMQDRTGTYSQMSPRAREQVPPFNPNVSDHRYMPPLSQFALPQVDQTNPNLRMPQLPHMSQLYPNYHLPFDSHVPPAGAHVAFPHDVPPAGAHVAFPARIPPVSQMLQMEPLVDHRLASLEQENLNCNMNEGYLSPASAMAQGWTPQVIYVPSPMIHTIPSPMPNSMIPSPSLPTKQHISPEVIARFNHGNAGLGLVNPEINPENQELVQSSFEDMLSSLGLLPSNSTEPEGLDGNFQKWTALKGKDRTLYKCPWAGCEKTFTRPYNLKSHYRGHTGERPFVCNVCFTGFARKHDLKRHAKIHDGLKSFSCPFCHKCFTRSDALRRHLRNDRSGKESSCSLKQAQITREHSASSSKD